MAETKFKVGDKVRYIEYDSNKLKHGAVYKVSSIIHGSSGLCFAEFPGDWWNDYRFELAKAGEQAISPKFILQYELDADPFEFFATEKEARTRIAELADRSDLKRDSIRLIEIRKIRTVKLGHKITISK